MRRALSLGLALLAVAASLALVAWGAWCGIRATRAECGPEGCGEPVVECASYVHPLAWPAVGVAVVAAAAAWRGAKTVPLALGVVASGVGTLLGLSLGAWGLLLAALLLATGTALPPRPGREGMEKVLSVAAVAFAAVPPLVVMALHASIPEPAFGKTRPPPAWAVYGATLLPVALWLGLWGWLAAGADEDDAEPAA